MALHLTPARIILKMIELHERYAVFQKMGRPPVVSATSRQWSPTHAQPSVLESTVRVDRGEPRHARFCASFRLCAAALRDKVEPSAAADPIAGSRSGNRSTCLSGLHQQTGPTL